MTQWPSVEAYDSFKDYVTVFLQLIKTPASGQAKDRFDDLKSKLRPAYDNLQKALAVARKRR